MKNIVDLVITWSKVFSAPISEPIKKVKLEKNNVTRGLKLVNEELTELKKELFERKESSLNLKPKTVFKEDYDVSNVRKEYSDLLWVVIRLGLELGVNIEEDLNILFEENMSKMAEAYK